MVEPKKIDGLHNIPTTAGFAGPGGGFEGGAAAGFEIDDASKHKKADEREVEKSLEDTDAFDAIDVNAIRARNKAGGANETVMSKITSTGVGDSSLSSLVAQAEGEAAADVRDSLYATQQMPAVLGDIDSQEPPRPVQAPIRDFGGEYPYKLYRPGTYAREHIRITATKLSDGRDFFYIDDNPEYVSGHKTRELIDPRKLPYRFTSRVDENGNEVPSEAPQMRQDPLTGDWIPMSRLWAKRPATILSADSNNHGSAADSAADSTQSRIDPFAGRKPQCEYQNGEIPDEDYDVVVFENRYPAMAKVAGVPNTTTYVDGNPLWKQAPAAGRCEVICFSSNEDMLPANLSVLRMRTIVEAWAFRTAEISQIEGIEQIYPFENHGSQIGVTLHHPHGQIYAYPFIAPRLEQELRHTEAYFERTGSNLLKDLMNSEIEAKKRVIMHNHSWVAYVPAAARWPLEVHVAPVRDVLTLDQLDDQERWDLAQIYITLLRRANKFFGLSPLNAGESASAGNSLSFDSSSSEFVDLPYVAAWHQAPVHDSRRSHYRLNLQFFSFMRDANKIKYLAGSEAGMASWISDTTPELIAKRFQELGDVDLD
ncbi:galactose-1-phosphate uridylyltransferase [Bifidobacterium sp. UMB1197]|nr:galactose-1-phosphate uridylyltransferase [Bifidobacterium sp. UMB1197]